MLKENKQMKFNKFKLVFEDLMSNVNNIMQDSMVTYELFDNIINKNIAEALNLSEEELTQEYGKFTAQIADKDLILSTIYHGFHTPENEKEAEELANKIVVLNLAETNLPDEDYLFLQHESDLAENILKELQDNGYNELIEVYIK